jgi:hypothetical protein
VSRAETEGAAMQEVAEVQEVEEAQAEATAPERFWTPRRKAVLAALAVVGAFEAAARLRHERRVLDHAVAAWSLHEDERFSRRLRGLAAFELVRAMKPFRPAR